MRFSPGSATVTRTGIYSWDYLHELATRQQAMWQEYLQRLEAAGQSRDPDPGLQSVRPEAAQGWPLARGGANAPEVATND
jgi:hypothetical protein